MRIKKTTQKIAYNTSRSLVRTLTPFFLDVKAEGLENIPEGPVVLALNHCIKPDPFLIASLIDKQSHFWVDSRIYRSGLVTKMFLASTGHIECSKKKSQLGKTIDRSVDILKYTDDAIAIFVDGVSYSWAEDDSEFKLSKRRIFPGVAEVALRSLAPVIPVAMYAKEETAIDSKHIGRGIFENFKFLYKNKGMKYRVSFGEPIYHELETKKYLLEKIKEKQLELHNSLEAKCS